MVKLSKEAKQRLQQLFKSGQVAIRWGFIPLVIYLGLKSVTNPAMPKPPALSLVWTQGLGTQDDKALENQDSKGSQMISSKHLTFFVLLAYLVRVISKPPQLPVFGDPSRGQGGRRCTNTDVAAFPHPTPACPEFELVSARPITLYQERMHGCEGRTPALETLSFSWPASPSARQVCRLFSQHPKGTGRTPIRPSPVRATGRRRARQATSTTLSERSGSPAPHPLCAPQLPQPPHWAVQLRALVAVPRELGSGAHTSGSPALSCTPFPALLTHASPGILEKVVPQLQTQVDKLFRPGLLGVAENGAPKEHLPGGVTPLLPETKRGAGSSALPEGAPEHSPRPQPSESLRLSSS
ncbi:PREDICTED: uncharacterized protein LOC102829790 [Chrysochloris asiatica]|uniref:Mitochondrial import receptor subunit TOM7 homolog n=1 Tax=Chrysochloris asiatica TaxID=185453 RepID=A0A9B0U6M8_CHRAS|nr:PREDICTED: uncharacterized protein LOC102829790 [Chrysochloris asiatica]